MGFSSVRPIYKFTLFFFSLILELRMQDWVLDLWSFKNNGRFRGCVEGFFKEGMEK